MKKVLFATTNKNKIVRLKNFLRDTDLEIISLSDLNYKIDEPEEIGKNPIEIAQNKASYYWENLVDKVPVIAQDDTIEFLGVPELKSPRLSIKSPVIKMYGEFNDANAILFYTNLARKYGGRVSMRFNYGFGFCVDNKITGEGAWLDCVLVEDVSKVITPGYFLTAIIKVKLNEKENFYSEMNNDDQFEIDSDLARAVKKLLLRK